MNLNGLQPDWQSECGTVALFCADCLDILPQLPDGCVDAVVTDPPYGNNYSTGWRAGVYRPHTRITGDLLSLPLLNDTADAIAPLLNDTAAIYWCAAPDRLDMVLPILRRWDVVNVLCWDKGNCTAGDLDASYGKQWEAIVFARIGRSALVGGARQRHHSDWTPKWQRIRPSNAEAGGAVRISHRSPRRGHHPRPLHGVRHDRRRLHPDGPPVHRHREGTQVFRHRGEAVRTRTRAVETPIRGGGDGMTDTFTGGGAKNMSVSVTSS